MEKPDPSISADVFDLQVLLNNSAILIKYHRRNVWHEVIEGLHDRPKIIDHRSGDRLMIRKLVRALVHFK